MFLGAIDTQFREWLALNQDLFLGRTLFCGASGNFTIEQVLGPVAKAVHSNDVGLWSHFLGHQLIGRPARWEIKDPAWEWLRPYLEDNASAVIMCLFTLFRMPPTNHHNKRMYDGYLAGWEDNFFKTKLSIETAKPNAKVATYRSSDIFAFIDEARTIDPEGVFLAALPAEGKDETAKIYRRIEAVIGWDPVSYEPLDRDRKDQLFKKLRGSDYVLIDDGHREDYPAVMWKRKSRTSDTYLYCSMQGERVFVSQKTSCEPTYYPVLQDADAAQLTADAQLSFKRVKGPEINYFKNQYMKKTILFTDGPFNFLFFVDGKLFGAAVAAFPKYGKEGLYILSDFVVPVSTKRRLAKLLLLTLQTTDFRDALEEILIERVPWLETTAFSENAVSMKYRGVFELLKRGTDGIRNDRSGRGQHDNSVKFLNYGTKTGLHDTRGALEKWIKFRRK